MMMLIAIFSIVAVLSILYGVRLYLSGAKCLLRQRLDGKTVVITGCNTGIGFETVGELARRGARVIMACRDTDKCMRAKTELLNRYGLDVPDARSKNVATQFLKSVLTPISENQLICEQLDLSSFDSIRKFAQRILSTESCIHILINNAGIMTSEINQTAQDLELHMKVNHLGHFLLTSLLIPSLKEARSSRVINISSDSHYFAKINALDLNKRAYGSAYARSKLANVMHAIELSRRHSSDGICAVSLHPGLVNTDLFREPTLLNVLLKKFLRYFIKTPWEGAQTTLYCVLTTKLIPGGYYKNCRLYEPNKQTMNATVRSSFWETSLKLVGL